MDLSPYCRNGNFLTPLFPAVHSKRIAPYCRNYSCRPDLLVAPCAGYPGAVDHRRQNATPLEPAYRIYRSRNNESFQSFRNSSTLLRYGLGCHILKNRNRGTDINHLFKGNPHGAFHFFLITDRRIPLHKLEYFTEPITLKITGIGGEIPAEYIFLKGDFFKADLFAQPLQTQCIEQFLYRMRHRTKTIAQRSFKCVELLFVFELGNFVVKVVPFCHVRDVFVGDKHFQVGVYLRERDEISRLYVLEKIRELIVF